MSFQQNPSNWEPPDGLGYSSLRPVRLSGQGRAMVVISAVMLAAWPVLGLFLDSRAVRERDERQHLVSEGRETDAVITRVWRSGKDDADHMVAYRFTAAGEEIQGRSSAPARIWRNLEPGGSLPVRYVPSNPKINHPAEWRGAVLPRWLPLVLMPPFWIPAVMFTVLIRRQMRLLSEGRPAPGTITGVKRRDKTMLVTYEFRVLSGAIVKGKSSAGRRPPITGSAVCVLYDPENPRHNALYPLQLVRLQRS
jgi:uncharacterized protein DUF3592